MKESAQQRNLPALLSELRSAEVGTKYLTQHGYVKVKTEDGWRYEHRVVAERMLNRPLLSTEHVHHINGDKTDNRPENLRVCNGAKEHMGKEHGGSIEYTCLQCGKQFMRPRSWSGSGKFCSRKCFYNSLRGKPFSGIPERNRAKDGKTAEFVRQHQGKHFCQCGCGKPIPITKEHFKPSVGIPKYIKGHTLRKGAI